MANIKLKDLLKEANITMSGIVTESPWSKNEDDTPQIDVKELVGKINNFGSLGENIYGSGNLKLKDLVET